MKKVELTMEEAASIIITHLVSMGELDNKITQVTWKIDHFTPSAKGVIFEQEEE